MAQEQVPKELKAAMEVEQKILEEEIRPLVTQDIIEEHKMNPIGKHSDDLEKVLVFLRKHHNTMEGKYVIVGTKSRREYYIGVLSGVPGESPEVDKSERFSSRGEAEHAIFLRRLRDEGLLEQ